MNKSVAERFWEKVDIAGPDECWMWTAGRNPTGYGHFQHEGRRQFAHRVSVKLSGREPGDCVLHLCDMPACVNPVHLIVGTRRGNILDAKQKGRLPRGEKHQGSKLTKKQVLAIRADRRTITAIAQEYGVCISNVSRIKLRKTWAWIPEVVADAAARVICGSGGSTAPTTDNRYRLAEEQVLAIRVDTRPQKEIAHEFGVTQPTVSCIKLRKSWSWLD